MGLESATYINGLVASNPTSSDNANQGDNHIRLIKSAVKATFPNLTGAVTLTQGDINGVPAALDARVRTDTNAQGLNATQQLNARTNIGLATSDGLTEGATNLYFTNARARGAISASGDISYNPTTGVISFSAAAAPVTSVAGKTGAVTLSTTDVSEGSNQYFTTARARSSISVSGGGSYNSTTGVITINASAVTSVAGRTGAVTLSTTDISGLDTALAGKLSTTGGSLSGSLSVSGTITATGDITAFSDIRVKENVETITEALFKVKQLRGVSYVSKIDHEPKIGVIAQEVERVIPEVVKTHSDGIKSVAYQNLVGLLIEAIKDLEERVAELENR